MSRTAATARVGDLGINSALHLYGAADSNISFGNQTFLDGTPFTFGARCFPTNSSMTSDDCLFSYCFDTITTKGYSIRANGTNRKLEIYYSGAANKSTTNYRMIGKHYVFVDFDGSSECRVYRNTTLMDTVTILANVAHSTNGLYFGTRDNTARYFSGVMGDGCVYNRLLTDAEREDIVTNAKYPSTGAQIIFKCNEGTGTTITDYSGNSRNGTVTSGLWRNSPFNA